MIHLAGTLKNDKGGSLNKKKVGEFLPNIKSSERINSSEKNKIILFFPIPQMIAQEAKIKGRIPIKPVLSQKIPQSLENWG